MSNNQPNSAPGAALLFVLWFIVIVVVLCIQRCHQNEVEIGQKAAYAATVANEADQMIAAGNNFIAAVEAQENLNRMNEINAMQSALYSGDADVFNTQVAFGNYESRNDPSWVTRNKSKLADLQAVVTAERNAVSDAEKRSDKDDIGKHTAALEDAHKAVEAQLSIMNRYGIK